MRAVVQRVTSAQVTVEGQLSGQIDAGLCVLVGVGRDDGESDAALLADKVVRLRIFEDHAGKMNRSLLDTASPGACDMISPLFPLTNGNNMQRGEKNAPPRRLCVASRPSASSERIRGYERHVGERAPQCAWGVCRLLCECL